MLLNCKTNLTDEIDIQLSVKQRDIHKTKNCPAMKIVIFLLLTYLFTIMYVYYFTRIIYTVQHWFTKLLLFNLYYNKNLHDSGAILTLNVI